MPRRGNIWQRVEGLQAHEVVAVIIKLTLNPDYYTDSIK